MSVIFKQILDNIDATIAAYSDDPEKFMQLSFQDSQRNVMVTARTFSDLKLLRDEYQDLLRSTKGSGGYGKVTLERLSL